MESIIIRLDLLQLITGFIASLFLGIISYRLGALNRSGVFGMMIIGTVVFGLGGMLFAIPLIFFFISSSLFSLLKTSAKEDAMATFEKTGPRDIWQVMANGGVGAVCVLLYFITGRPIWFFPYLASLCESTADTWATELGILSRSKPVSIVSFKKVEAGRSGGITHIGTFSALAGSVATMIVTYGGAALFPEISGFSLRYWLVCVNAGFAGSLLDSILGASIQAHHKCRVCGNIIERKIHCRLPAARFSGFRFVNNDVVNLVSASLAAAMVATIFFL